MLIKLAFFLQITLGIAGLKSQCWASDIHQEKIPEYYFSELKSQSISPVAKKRYSLQIQRILRLLNPSNSYDTFSAFLFLKGLEQIEQGHLISFETLFSGYNDLKNETAFSQFQKTRYQWISALYSFQNKRASDFLMQHLWLTELFVKAFRVFENEIDAFDTLSSIRKFRILQTKIRLLIALNKVLVKTEPRLTEQNFYSSLLSSFQTTPMPLMRTVKIFSQKKKLISGIINQNLGKLFKYIFNVRAVSVDFQSDFHRSLWTPSQMSLIISFASLIYQKSFVDYYRNFSAIQIPYNPQFMTNENLPPSLWFVDGHIVLESLRTFYHHNKIGLNDAFQLWMDGLQNYEFNEKYIGFERKSVHESFCLHPFTHWGLN